jgi:hypothetical protein
MLFRRLTLHRWGNKNLRIDGLKLHDKHQEYLVGQKPTRACVVLLLKYAP